MYLMVPKPLDSFNLLKVKGKVLKQRVLHASCEWYVSQVDVTETGLIKTTDSWTGSNPCRFV